MGLSPYPNPSDGGVLCIILVGTAISMSKVKDFFLSILHIAGIRFPSSLEPLPTNPPEDSYYYRLCPSETFMKKFRNLTPTIKFRSLSQFQNIEKECSVCLVEFGNNNEINHLSCGHIFHKICLEKWIKYWNVTCPLCRTRMVPQEMEQDLYI